MEFNYFKTSVMSVMAVGALAFSSSMMAAAPVSVLPQEGTQETLEDFTLIFNEGAEVAWNVAGTETTPTLTLNGKTCALAGPKNLSAEGNKLSINFSREFTRAGEYQLNIAPGSYTVDGVAGEACQFKWDVKGILLGYSVEPSASIVSEIQNIKITFNDNDVVTVTDDWGTDHGAILSIETEDGLKRRGTFFPDMNENPGNNLILKMNSPIYEPGDYVIEIAPNCILLDGVLYDQTITISYTVVEPSYPEINLSVNPATDVVETLDNVELTFGGVDLVEWAVTGTENSPYLEDMEGNRMGTFAKLGGQGNMLSMGFYTEFDVKGEYKVVIPEGSYVFQGIYHGMSGKEITLNYEVLGLTGYSVEPAVNVLSEIQNIKITFHEAKEVTLAEDLGTENTPLLYIINAEGERERRGTFFPEIVGGNNMLLTMRSPITEAGEYVVVVPGSTYFLDGEAGEDIELIYTVIGDQSLKYTVEPAEGTLSELHTIAITFDDCEEAVWNIEAIQNERSLCPTISSGESMKENLINLTSEGNVLYLAPYGSEAWTEAGSYIVTVPAGSYSVDGIEGDEIVLAYVLSGTTAVDSLFGEKKNLDVYDINGRLIIRNADADAVKALRGIYVIGGRKYIIR